MARRTSSDSELVARQHWESLAWTEYDMDTKLNVLKQVLPADVVEGPVARFFYHSEAVPHVLVMGGRSNQFTYHDESVLFDTFNERWMSAGPLPEGFSRVGAGCATLLDGRILLVGGYADSVTSPTDRCDIYDPETGMWSPAAPLSLGRFGLGVATIANGFVYAVGGNTGLHGPTSLVEYYDPEGDVWLPAPPHHQLPYPTAGGRLVASHGGVMLHVVGGCSDTFTASENVLTLDLVADFEHLEKFRRSGVNLPPVTGRWTVTHELRSRRAAAAVCVDNDDNLIVSGGFTEPGSVERELSTVEVINLKDIEAQSRIVGDMAHKRGGCVAVHVPAIGAVVVGGESTLHGSPCRVPPSPDLFVNHEEEDLCRMGSPPRPPSTRSQSRTALQTEPFTPVPNRQRPRNDNADDIVSPVVLPTSEIVGVGKWSVLPLMPEERTAAAVAVVWKLPRGFFYKPLVDLLTV
ncbi:kelch-like [Perkinsus olseni]|uniref:Kelch-like n=1 Tax=Perkinsus olseni TaxID=32597 RepID=A0A7J6QBY1_PEROL|nr:kelch-like [Perkinsus olseni]KAF4732465.1 kelch-like [Perkinsus olseni]